MVSRRARSGASAGCVMARPECCRALSLGLPARRSDRHRPFQLTESGLLESGARHSDVKRSSVDMTNAPNRQVGRFRAVRRRDILGSGFSRFRALAESVVGRYVDPDFGELPRRLTLPFIDRETRSAGACRTRRGDRVEKPPPNAGEPFPAPRGGPGPAGAPICPTKNRRS